jgi:hypothetical protein
MPERRAALDSVIQTSTIDLFQAYGIAVAPILRYDYVPKALENHLAGLTTFAGNGLSGTLALLVPEEVVVLAKDHPGSVCNPSDWTRELTNQLIGRIKNRLAQFQVVLRAGFPNAMTGSSMPPRGRQKPFAVYGFTTLRGQVVVTLTGSVDFSVFQYSGLVNAANEGDIILF